MKRLILSTTDYTPAIDLNPSSLTMTFTGVSRPENVGLFYQQVIDWVADLSLEIEEVVPATMKLIFKLDYCNSASQKYILMILEKLVELKDRGLEVSLEWWYDEGDDKMLEDGEDIADAIGLQFTYKPF
jgi:hypothetical protein